MQQVGAENVPWRVTDLNKDFSLCETYPTVLGVPANATEDDLRVVAQFRSKGRIPVSPGMLVEGSDLQRKLNFNIHYEFLRLVLILTETSGFKTVMP